MVHKGHVPTAETFSFLLMSCIKDSESGFRYALQVCLYVLNGKKKALLYYNLSLKCTEGSNFTELMK